MHHETCARCIVLWQVGDSFLQNGGTAAELLKHNLWDIDKVTKKEVVINGTVIEGLKHKFILMPLTFTIQSEETATAALARTNAWDIVSGQVYICFTVSIFAGPKRGRPTPGFSIFIRPSARSFVSEIKFWSLHIH